MGVILGLGEGGSRLPGFVFNKTMSKYLGQELAEKIRNPVIFQIVSAGKSGAVSPEQVAWVDYLFSAGYVARTARGADDAIAMISDYLKET